MDFNKFFSGLNIDPGSEQELKQTFGDIGPWSGQFLDQMFDYKEAAPKGVDFISAPGSGLAALFGGSLWPKDVHKENLLKSILEQYPEVESIKKVGSYARGEARLKPIGCGMKQGRSDLDIVLEFNPADYPVVRSREDFNFIKEWAGMHRDRKKQTIVDFILKPTGVEGTTGQHRWRLENNLPVPEEELWNKNKK